jgi:hypothetical protein
MERHKLLEHTDDAPRRGQEPMSTADEPEQPAN